MVRRERRLGSYSGISLLDLGLALADLARGGLGVITAKLGDVVGVDGDDLVVDLLGGADEGHLGAALDDGALEGDAVDDGSVGGQVVGREDLVDGRGQDGADRGGREEDDAGGLHFDGVGWEWLWVCCLEDE